MQIESERMKNTRRSISIEQEQREGVYDCRQIGTLGGRVACPTGLQFFGDDDYAFIIQDLTFRCDCVTDEQVTIAFDEIER